MDSLRTNIVGVYEAKKRFLQLLEQVAAGEEIIITRHGQPVARLTPIRSIQSQENRRQAILKMRELASRNRLNGLRIRDLIAQGRK